MAEPTKQIIRSGLAGVAYRNAPNPFQRASLGDYIAQAADQTVEAYSNYQHQRKEDYLEGVKEFSKYPSVVHGSDQKGIKAKQEEYSKKLKEMYKSGANPTEISEYVEGAASELKSYVVGSNSFKENGLKAYDLANKDPLQDVGKYESWYAEQSQLPPTERRDPLEAVMNGDFVNMSSDINSWVENNMITETRGRINTDGDVVRYDTYSVMPEITKKRDDGSYELNLTDETIDSYVEHAKANERVDRQMRLKINARKREEFQQGVSDFRDKSPEEQYRIIAGEEMKLHLAKKQIAIAKGSNVLSSPYGGKGGNMPEWMYREKENQEMLGEWITGIRTGNESMLNQLKTPGSPYGIDKAEYVRQDGEIVGIRIAGTTKEKLGIEDMIQAMADEQSGSKIDLSQYGADKTFNKIIPVNINDPKNILNNTAPYLKMLGIKAGLYGTSAPNPDIPDSGEGMEIINALNGN